MRKRRQIGFTVALLLALAALPLTASAALDQYWVDDDWTNQTDVDAFDPSLVWQTDAFASIQAAIDAASDYHTVNVRPGLYVEAITVSHPVNLKGATAAVNKNGYTVPANYAWDTSVESVIRHPNPAGGYNAIVDIYDVSDVTFEGFVVEEQNAVANKNVSLVRVYANAGNVQNVFVRNNVIGPNTNVVAQDGAQGRMCLYLINHPYGTNAIQNSTFSGNKIFDAKGNGNNIFLWTAYYAYGASGPAPMTGTVIEDNEIYGSHRSGIETAGGFSDLVIRNNEIYGQTRLPGDTPNLLKYGHGILMIRGASDKMGDHTTAYGPENILIEGNDIHDNEKSGIYMGPRNDSIEIRGNTLRNNGWNGVLIDLAGNFWNPTYEVPPTSEQYAIYDGSTNVVVADNSITSNTDCGVKVNGTPTNGFAVDARFNWWDAVDGPGPVGPGSGDNISANVDYAPWLGAAAGTSPQTYIVKDPSVDIQDIIDEASPGDTIILGDGVFTVNDLLIDKELKITAGSEPIFDGGGSGIAFEITADNVEITSVTIRNYDVGVSVTAGVSGTSLQRVKFYDNNQFAVWSEGSAVDADLNWWGTISAEGYDGVPGLLDLISGPVTFDPWYADLLLGSTLGFAANTYVDDDWAGSAEGDSVGGHTYGYDAFSVIQDGGYNLTTGGQLNVANGTYATSAVNFLQPLTLVGESEAGVLIHPEFTPAGSDQRAINIYGADTTIRNLTIDGSAGVAGRRYFNRGICGYGDNARLEDVTVMHCSERGAQISGSGSHVIDDCTIDDIPTWGYLHYAGHLTLTNSELTNMGYVSFYVSGANSCTVDGNVFTGGYCAVYSPATCTVSNNDFDGVTIPIFMGNNLYPTPNDCRILNNTIANIGADGIGINLVSMGPNALVDGNQVDATGATNARGILDWWPGVGGQVTISTNTVTCDGDACGIMIGAHDNNQSVLPSLVMNNTITASSIDKTNLYDSVGIFLVNDPVTPILADDGEAPGVLTANTISGFQHGVAVWNGRPTDGHIAAATIGDGTTAGSNDITGCDNAVFVYDSNGPANGFVATATIIGNMTSFTGNVVGVKVDGGEANVSLSNISSNDTGIHVANSGAAAILNNTISGNDRGVLLESGASATINMNDLSGNSVYTVDNQTANDVDATLNWWGSADESDIVISIWDELDNASLGLVDYSPWYNDASKTGTSNSSAPNTVWVDDNYTALGSGGHAWNYDAFDTVQEGIDAVAADGTVNVAAGQYGEALAIGKGLDLLGVAGAIIDGTGLGVTDGVTISAGDVDMDAFAIQDFDGNGVTITGTAAQVNVTACQIQNNTGDGVFADSTGGFLGGVSNCTLASNGGRGVMVQNGAATVDQNSFLGNGGALEINKGVGATVDASLNWWGVTAPGAVDAEVGADIDFTPWLANGTDTAPGTIGFQPDTALLYVYAGSPQTGATARIQEAVDVVGCSEIILGAGTYDGGVTVNQAIDIAGITPLTRPVIDGGGAGTGLTLNASPSRLSLVRVQNCATGVQVTDSADCVITYCDFLGHSAFAVANSDTGTSVDARYCSWGALDGPNNPPVYTGSGNAITDWVDAIPFSGGSFADAPEVVSIEPAGDNPVQVGSASFIVTFTLPVQGVELDDFQTHASGGVTGVNLSSVAAVPGDDTRWELSFTVTGTNGLAWVDLIEDGDGSIISIPAGEALTADFTSAVPQEFLTPASAVQDWMRY